MTTKALRVERTECADCKIAEMERAVAVAKESVADAVKGLALALVDSKQVKDEIHARSRNLPVVQR